MNLNQTILKDCGKEHLPAILEILNDAIVNSTALYDYQPRTMEMMEVWFEVKRKGDYPVLGLFDFQGLLLGFASYGSFRNFPAYKYSIEHSIYIQNNFRGKGLAAYLLPALIEKAEAQNYHLMLGAIDAENIASIRLHEMFGFAHSGTIKQAGFKFGKWLDLAFYQLVLSTPAHPVDG